MSPQAASHEPTVLPELIRTGTTDLATPTFVRPYPSEIGRSQKDEHPLSGGHADDRIRMRKIGFIRRGEISRSQERFRSGRILGGVLGKLVFDQVHDDGIESLLLTTTEVELGLLEGQLGDERPRGVALDKERPSILIHEIAFVCAYP